MIPTHRWTKDEGLKSATLVPEVSIDWSEAVSPRTIESPQQFAHAPPASAWLQGPPATAAPKRSNTASTMYLPLSAFTFSTGSAPTTPADAQPTSEPVVVEPSPSPGQYVPFIHDAPAMYAWLQPTVLAAPEAFRSAQKQFNKELRRLAKTQLPPQEPQVKTNYRSEFPNRTRTTPCSLLAQPAHANSSCTASALEAIDARIPTTSTSAPRPRRRQQTFRRSATSSRRNPANSSTPQKDAVQEMRVPFCTSSWCPLARQ